MLPNFIAKASTLLILFQVFIILNLRLVGIGGGGWGGKLICLWVGDVGNCQELMTFRILFGFLPHSLVSVLIGS